MRGEYDFSDSKRGAIIKTAKERITIRLDPEIIQWFRDRVKSGGNYQTLINEALRAHIERRGGADLESTLRRVLRHDHQAYTRDQVAGLPPSSFFLQTFPDTGAASCRSDDSGTH